MMSVPIADERTRRRLRHGEFADPDYVVARHAFLNAVVEVDTSALWDLERWARQLAAESPTTTMARYDAVVRHWVEDPDQTCLLDEAVPLDAEILSWLSRKRLRETWIEAAILWTLYWWTNAIIKNQAWNFGIAVPPSKDATGAYFRPDGVVWRRPTDLDTADPTTGKIDLAYHVWFNLRANTRRRSRTQPWRRSKWRSIGNSMTLFPPAAPQGSNDPVKSGTIPNCISNGLHATRSVVRHTVTSPSPLAGAGRRWIDTRFARPFRRRPRSLV